MSTSGARPTLTIAKWLQLLPRNAHDLTFSLALETIACTEKCSEKEPLVLFVGVDEFQCISKIPKRPISNLEGANLVTDLLDMFVGAIAYAPGSVIILPLLAGTDLGSIPVIDSSTSDIARVPMPLLDISQVEAAISKIQHGSMVLSSVHARRHLFYFGGVPRFFADYCNRVIKDTIVRGSNSPTEEILEKNFRKVWHSRIDSKLSRIFNTHEISIIVATAISGRTVRLSSSPFGDKRTWLKLRDSNVCLIDEENRVWLPYLFILSCTENQDPFDSPPMKYFMESLKWLSRHVDKAVYDVEPWVLWEKFGACFHALRINSFLVLGYKSVPFSYLCSGALMNDCTEEVNLRPVKIIRSSIKYDEEIPERIGVITNPSEVYNWVKGDNHCGVVVLNAPGGEGLDIFFALERTHGKGYVICVDQRKRVSQGIGKKGAKDLLEEENILPDCCKDATLIRGLFNPYPHFKVSASELPSNCFVVSYSTTYNYHLSLYTHPASSPCININYDEARTPL
eukprot:TRINITY_DN4278_c1_g1_i1.p1 TRINITY_DN4278_c1_g1~~TRINITY_DN4278_c1_g1_i1.p1  ORF type:complete len:570 (+),score=29.88 TRINITY_DN4278_c1_g1_i1:178-1710(+)